jgi:putative salt-induced outer membrane protein
MKHAVLSGALLFAVLSASSVAGSSRAFADPMPEAVSRMIATAAKSSDPAALDNVIKTAKAAYPESAKDIDSLVASIKNDAETAQKIKLAQQRYYQGWKGEGEVGATLSTGNTNTTDVAVGLHLIKDGIRWRHKFNATAESQRTQGVAGTDKYLGAYEINFKLKPVVYLFGLVQWERDRFAGIGSRATQAFGAGYSVVKKPNLTWDITAGPAFRETHYVSDGRDAVAEAGLGTHVIWNLSPTTVFTEDGSIYAGSGNSTYRSTTAVTTKLVKKLAARVSFDAKKETTTAPVPGDRKTDTTSRVTLVYGF